MSGPFDDYEPDIGTQQRRARKDSPDAPLPAATIGESFDAGWKAANVGADWGANQQFAESEERRALVKALKAKGYGVEDWSPGAADIQRKQRAFNPRYPSFQDATKEKAVFAAVRDAAARDPAFAATWGDVQDLNGLKVRARAKRGEELEKAESVYARSSGLASAAYFGGGIAGRWWDPLNYVGPGEGAIANAAVGSIARQVISTGIRAGLTNMAVTAAIEPLVQVDSASNLDRERGAGEVFTDLAAAGAFGFALGAAGKGVGEAFNWRRARGGFTGSLDQRAANALTWDVSRWDDAAALAVQSSRATGGVFHADHVLAGMGRSVLGDSLTPEQSAALAVLDREADVDQISPYQPSPVGDQMHRTRLAAEIEARMMAVNDEVPPAPVRAEQPVPVGVAPPVSRETIPAGTPLGYAPEATLKRKIGRAESPNDWVKNPDSSALGRYQFTKGTWRTYYKRRFGTQGLSDPQIDAKRLNGDLQEILVDDLIADNKRALRKGGEAVTSGNLYLAHFAGYDGALRVLKADPNASIAPILGADVMYSNRKIKGFTNFTAQDLINWAHKKMGDSGQPVRGHDVPVIKRESFQSDDDWDMAQHMETQLAMERAEMARLDAREAAAERGEAPLIDEDDYDISGELSPFDSDGGAGRAPITRIEIPPQPDDIAIAADGSEQAVRYAIVELRDLIVSHDDVGRVNPDYPPSIQPRDRARATSQAQISEIAARLDPRRLGRSINAADGAPIISDDGVSVSGNGRLLALRRAYQSGGDRADAYRAHVEAYAPEATDMEAPVLVRTLPGDMDEEGLTRFAHAANERDTAGYSATEQALIDAAYIDDDMLALYRPGDLDLLDNRDFVRSYLKHVVAPSELGAMITADKLPSAEAYRRIKAGLLAKAYGQNSLIADIVESSDTNIKAIGGALSDASAHWARMVSAAHAGGIDPRFDLTGHLNEAVAIIGKARDQRLKVRDIVNQSDIFSGEAVDPHTEALLRLFFSNEDMTKATARKALAERLSFYADEAMKSEAGPGLFGDALQSDPMALLSLSRNRKYDNGGLLDSLSDESPKPDGASGVDAPESGRSGDGPQGEGVPGEGGSEGAGTGESGWLDPEALRAFDDPHGEGIKAQSEGLEHDMRMAADDPAADQVDPSPAQLFKIDGNDQPLTGKAVFDDIDKADRELAALIACAAPKVNKT